MDKIVYFIERLSDRKWLDYDLNWTNDPHKCVHFTTKERADKWAAALISDTYEVTEHMFQTPPESVSVEGDKPDVPEVGNEGREKEYYRNWQFEEQFRIANPQTIGETDKYFYLDNYKDWLEKQLAITMRELSERITRNDAVEWISENFKRTYPTDKVFKNAEKKALWFPITTIGNDFEKRIYFTDEVLQLFDIMNLKSNQ